MSLEIVDEPQPVRKKPIEAEQRFKLGLRCRFLDSNGTEVGHTVSKNFYRNEAILNQYRKY